MENPQELGVAEQRPSELDDRILERVLETTGTDEMKTARAPSNDALRWLQWDLQAAEWDVLLLSTCLKLLLFPA